MQLLEGFIKDFPVSNDLLVRQLGLEILHVASITVNYCCTSKVRTSVVRQRREQRCDKLLRMLPSADQSAAPPVSVIKIVTMSYKKRTTASCTEVA